MNLIVRVTFNHLGHVHNLGPKMGGFPTAHSGPGVLGSHLWLDLRATSAPLGTRQVQRLQISLPWTALQLANDTGLGEGTTCKTTCHPLLDAGVTTVFSLSLAGGWFRSSANGREC